MKLWKTAALAGVLLVGPVLGASAASAASYTVQPNDTMYAIAMNNGFSLQSLIDANPQVANPNIIWEGMSLQLPSNGSAPADSQPAASSSYAQQVVDLVNQERAKAGLQPLQADGPLSNMALEKAKDMDNNHYFDHNSPTYGSPFDMMTRFGISYSYAGENIAMGQRDPQEVMKAWMNSEGHRQNIMNPNFTIIGTAYYNGQWVQEFVGR
ncbi:hypothetical protein J31TS4_09530 [Paenibacillus sp. J31TS4]|uniref:CAP domain-containing protein n=1 Tax=Paenibacillus sp. J31TS4 TaxID=2807195 RepID=UPI001B0E2900|nr:CAP domain-containing protein [Paenibacillus sp. J31TS4]GIP37673.1 hypothetical protein J31TS4_09530 [Paenibacillus sp. J31TS4]